MIKVEKEGGITRVILTADQFQIGNNQSWKFGEKTMKIKAKHDCYYDRYKAGDVFEVIHQTGLSYRFLDHDGNDCTLTKEYFDIVTEYDTIKLGSEWVSSSGVDWKVVYSGKSIVITHGNCENTIRREKFLEKYKPKPKTVTMYFYAVGDGYKAYDKEQLFNRAGKLLFTRVIELP